MKIALIGYGRMGHIIEKVAQERGHVIVCTIDAGEEEKFSSQEFLSADAAIEFSVPSAAVGNIKRCLAAGIPIICGTTGWLDALPEIENVCLAEHGRLMYASNFSIGVNLFWAFNRYMARVMEKFPAYRPILTETHHIHKLDHPSGTAITTAEQTIANNSLVEKWEESEVPVADPKVLSVRYRREDEVPGIHTMEWNSPQDVIMLTHSAKSREGFAIGAVMSAEWIAARTQPGIYSVSDMLGEVTNTTGIF